MGCGRYARAVWAAAVSAALLAVLVHGREGSDPDPSAPDAQTATVTQPAGAGTASGEGATHDSANDLTPINHDTGVCCCMGELATNTTKGCWSEPPYLCIMEGCPGWCERRIGKKEHCPYIPVDGGDNTKGTMLEVINAEAHQAQYHAVDWDPTTVLPTNSVNLLSGKGNSKPMRMEPELEAMYKERRAQEAEKAKLLKARATIQSKIDAALAALQPDPEAQNEPSKVDAAQTSLQASGASTPTQTAEQRLVGDEKFERFIERLPTTADKVAALSDFIEQNQAKWTDINGQSSFNPSPDQCARAVEQVFGMQQAKFAGKLVRSMLVFSVVHAKEMLQRVDPKHRVAVLGAVSDRIYDLDGNRESLLSGLPHEDRDKFIKAIEKNPPMPCDKPGEDA